MTQYTPQNSLDWESTSPDTYLLLGPTSLPHGGDLRSFESELCSYISRTVRTFILESGELYVINQFTTHMAL